MLRVFKNCLFIMQIRDLVTGVKRAKGILNRCPSCFRNFLQNICEFTCSPNQSKFIDVIDIKVNDETNSELVCIIVRDKTDFFDSSLRQKLMLMKSMYTSPKSISTEPSTRARMFSFLHRANLPLI